ncbi:MAG: ABC transporter ATP-binding protein [Clostridia bacterium]|nr:ABC transporter ATP-binding protein [Clostridia bacterium]
MRTPIIDLQHVSKHFGGRKAVDDVSLTIEDGELHGLIGPNGAGKTTILKLITGTYELTAGSVHFDGKDISKEKIWKRVRDGISIKMQIPGVYHDLTLRDNMRIAAQRYVAPRHLNEEIDRLIEMVGIQNLGNPLVKNMPHGQQQWLEIAMSLASKPRLLLLDEPAAGMGPEETQFTAEIVKRINATGMTIIFIDHDMDFVEQIAKRVTVLHQGRIFAEGTMAEIRQNEEVAEIYLGKA